MLTERNTEIIKNINNINLTLTDLSTHIEQPEINIEKEVESYLLFIQERLRISPLKIIPYNNDYLPIISNRAISRIKPAGEKGQGFRDTLIWLTMIDYCKKSLEKQLIFISINTDDFASPDKSSLHHALTEECDKAKIKINYFKSIKDFIENHSVKIDFITHDWIAENLDYQEVEYTVLDYLNSIKRRGLISWIYKETKVKPMGYNAVSFSPDHDDDLSVYEMSDNTMIINLTVGGYAELDFTVRVDDSWDGEYAYVDQSYNENVYITASLSLTLVDNKIEDIAMIDLTV